MQVVKILRELWRVRLLVAIAAALSLLLALMVAFKLPSLETRRYVVGVATARMLVDTPKSQVIEVAPKGSEALGVRANLLANLMVQGVVKNAIAERAGLAPKDLEGVAESAADGTPAAQPANPRGHVLSTRVVASTDGDLPIIEIEARGPDADSAARLADAAIDGLTAYLDDKASAEQVSAVNRLRVGGLGAPAVGEEVRGPGIAVAFALGLFVFLAACAAIVGLLAVIRAWHTASAEEQLDQIPADRLVALDGFLASTPATEPVADEEEPRSQKRRRGGRSAAGG